MAPLGAHCHPLLTTLPLGLLLLQSLFLIDHLLDRHNIKVSVRLLHALWTALGPLLVGCVPSPL